MSSQQLYECPVCGEKFPEKNINAHVNLCLQDTEITVSSKRKNSTVSDNVERLTVPSKRLKSSPEKEICSEVDIERKQTENVPEKTLCHESEKQSPNGTKSSPSAFAKMFQPKGKLSRKPGQQTDVLRGKAVVQSPVPSSTSTTSGSFGKYKTSKDEGSSSRSTSGFSHSVTNKSSLSLGNVPLAEVMRPLTLEDYIGQEHVVGDGKMLRKLLQSTKLPSMIFWGPPGCGKTTLARIVSQKCKSGTEMRFAKLSATTSGVADVKEAIKVARNDLNMFKRKTVLFIDEIHRFNKLQQDSFLPHVEDGTITLIGATTENPSFQVNNALLSRCKVIVLEKLSTQAVEKILDSALNKLGISRVGDDEKPSNGCDICITDAAVRLLAGFCDGDARSALNALEAAYNSQRSNECKPVVIGTECVKEVMQRTHVQYDRAGDEHYHCASALQKSIRGSSDNGAIYWMTRMLEGGEDPLFVARRLVVCASEDIGLADPQALPIAMATFQACQVIGRPECFINLAHCVTYLARAPKSNESYSGLKAAQDCIQQYPGPLPGVPLHLRNASTKLMKELGYGKGYEYSHNHTGPSKQTYLPKELQHMDFFKAPSYSHM